MRKSQITKLRVIDYFKIQSLSQKSVPKFDNNILIQSTSTGTLLSGSQKNLRKNDQLHKWRLYRMWQKSHDIFRIK